jgi:hypothetical protein
MIYETHSHAKCSGSTWQPRLRDGYTGARPRADPAGELVYLTVYKRGAEEVARRLAA